MAKLYENVKLFFRLETPVCDQRCLRLISPRKPRTNHPHLQRVHFRSKRFSSDIFDHHDHHLALINRITQHKHNPTGTKRDHFAAFSSQQVEKRKNAQNVAHLFSVDTPKCCRFLPRHELEDFFLSFKRQTRNIAGDFIRLTWLSDRKASKVDTH